MEFPPNNIQNCSSSEKCTKKNCFQQTVHENSEYFCRINFLWRFKTFEIVFSFVLYLVSDELISMFSFALIK